MNCLECQELLHQSLDGTAVLQSAPLTEHLATCPTCREWYAAGQRLQQGLRLWRPAEPPPQLSAQIVARVLADQRTQRQRRRLRVMLGGAALAATLVLAVLAVLSWRARENAQSVAGNNLVPPPAHQVVPPTPPVEEVPSLRDSVAEAGSAVMDLTRRTADETVGQGRLLLPVVPGKVVAEAPGPLPDATPPVRSLLEAGQGVSDDLEPVTSSARRAVGLFLRDLPPMGTPDRSGL